MNGGNNRIALPGAVGISGTFHPGPNATPAQAVITGQGGVAVAVFGGMTKLEMVAAQLMAADAAHGESKFIERYAKDAAELLKECDKLQAPKPPE